MGPGAFGYLASAECTEYYKKTAAEYKAEIVEKFFVNDAEILECEVRRP